MYKTILYVFVKVVSITPDDIESGLPKGKLIVTEKFCTVNSCWGELDTVSGSIREWICCALDITGVWIYCVMIPESRFPVLWTLFTSG